MEEINQATTPAPSTAGFVSLKFTGTTNEYFKIWIVNIALTLVTLGIYSAWATVRKNRYFYGHTSLKDGRFDYHAQPQAILIGRIIAAVFLGAYLFSEYIHILAPLVVVFVIFALTPWLVVRSRVFKLRNTSLNNVRFGFQPDYNGAMKAYWGGALISVVTLGLATPVAIRWRNLFLVNNSRFGKSAFTFDVALDEFYSIAFRALGLGLGLALLAMLTSFGIGFLVSSIDIPAETLNVMLANIGVGIVLIVYAAVFVYMHVRTRNLIVDHTTIEGKLMRSDWSASAMAWLYASNILAIVLSFGLATPWAQIRLAKYRAENTLVAADFAWQDIAVAPGEAGSAAGEAIGDAFDVGVDIGF